MTHDELLNKLNFVWSVDEPQLNKAEQLRLALRAVVELHTETEDGYCAWCYLCNYDRTGLCMDNAMYAYPCPTIQEIEKELQ